MMRFLLDCLRPGRQRASCGRENSVEIPVKEKETNDNEIKDLEDVVAMEEGALQKEGTVCRDTQQALEMLANRKKQLKEETERIQEERKRQGQLLLSLQEEQEESEQMVKEYDAELTRAKQELQLLQEEIEGTRARVEDTHGRMGLLKHSISESYQEITEAKQRLGELITEMIAIEACASEVNCHQTLEPLSISLESSREDEDDDEGSCGHVCEDENTIKKHREKNESSEPEQTEEGFEKLQRSAENLKSSGSSSFTEITLTEFKEEDASPKSLTPQNTGSGDLEEEDFEIVQSLMIKPANQAANKELDFFHPDPFVDPDVFGDDRFPGVDMTEFLTGDPFKGSDPFASDIFFPDASNSPLPQDSPLSMKESKLLPTGFQELPNEKEHGDIFNVAHISAGPDCGQCIDPGMFEQNLPELADLEGNMPYNEICPQMETNLTTSKDLDSVEPKNTPSAESDLATSSEFKVEGRFDPILCEDNGIHEFESSSASTVDSSFDGDFCATEHLEDKPVAEAGPSYVRRNQALCGLQRIDTSSYTSFPLSPEAYDPQPEFPDITGNELFEDPLAISSDHETVIASSSSSKHEMEDTENLSHHNESGNPTSLSEETSPAGSDPCFPDPDPSSPADDRSQSVQPSDTDGDDHKFGDIYFFTVRLDPGSPDASPISPEGNAKKKSECDHASPESNDTDEFDETSPDTKDSKWESVAEENFVKETENPSVKPAEDEPKMSDPDSSYDGLELFENNFTSGGNTTFNNVSELMENADPAYTADTFSERNNTEAVDQYLISPLSGNAGMFVPDGHKLCARNPFSFDSGSIDHCDYTETCIVKQSDSCDTELKGLALLHPVPVHNKVSTFEVKNSVHSESGRLDSGYHEFGGLYPSSPVFPVSTDLALDCVIHNSEILSPDDLILQVPDPFSPEANQTKFDLDICSPAADEDAIKESHHTLPVQDLFEGSFSESEFDSFDPFGPMPNLNEGQPCPGSTQNYTRSYEETRSSSWDSGVSQSPHLHSDFVANKEDNQADSNLVNVDADNTSYSSSYSTTESFFESDSNILTDLSSLKSNVEQITKNSEVNVTAMEDLAEIDFFCSELSKMVASRSSDTVQQSVTEMLFGSNPDTTKFYPWDLENINVVAGESSQDGDLTY